MNLIWEYSFLGLYALTLALSLVRFARYYDTPLRYLPILLAYTLITEIIGILVRDREDYSIFLETIYVENNWLVFNIFTLVQFGFFFWLYHRYVTAYKIRWLTVGGAVLFGLVSLANAWFYSFYTVAQTYAYWVGGIVLCALAALYLLQELFHATPGAAKRNLLVWLSIGFLVFNLAYLPIEYLRYQVVHAGWEYHAWIRLVQLAAIYAMYGCIALGLIVMKPMKAPGCPGSKN